MRKALQALLAVLLTAPAAVIVAAPPAAAALPDKFGFVQWNGAATVAGGTRPAGTAVAGGPSGVYTIRFPGLAAPGGVVHVTAINTGPRWCQAVRWGASGPDEIVIVQCTQPGGALVPTAFTAVFDSSSGAAGSINGRFGYVDWNAPAGSLYANYNSTGAINSVSALPGAVYEVRLPGLGTPGPVAGSVQVTAVGSTPARCKVRNWTSTAVDQVISVACYNAAGAPFTTRFTLSYQYNQSLWGAGWPPRWFGYLLYPGGGPQTNFNSQLGFGANTAAGAGTGLILVTFPQLATLPDTVQVTAAGNGSEFCNLLYPWAHVGADTIVRDVACYNTGGARVTTGFTISANSAL